MFIFVLIVLINLSFFREIEAQNRKLQRELRQKETTIDELKLRIKTLERKLDVNSTDTLDKGLFFIYSKKLCTTVATTNSRQSL